MKPGRRKKQLSKGRKWKSGVESSERKRERKKSCLPSQLLVLRGKRSNGVTEEGEEWPPKRGEKKEGRKEERMTEIEKVKFVIEDVTIYCGVRV